MENLTINLKTSKKSTNNMKAIAPSILTSRLNSIPLTITSTDKADAMFNGFAHHLQTLYRFKFSANGETLLCRYHNEKEYHVLTFHVLIKICRIARKFGLMITCDIITTGAIFMATIESNEAQNMC
jgi:hypothetical protein